jgi:regulator of RNase E activity RraA
MSGCLAAPLEKENEMSAEGIDLERLAKIPVATLTQVMQGIGRPRAFIEGIAPLDPGQAIAGRARTLRFLPVRNPETEAARPLSENPQRQAIDSIEPGEVLVIDAGGEVSGGMIGDILSTRIQYRGGVGVVIDGGLRDISQIRRVGLPVWARGFHGGSGYRALYAADFDNPVRCGGVTVMVGDYVVADGDGEVVIPPELVEEVMAAALEIEHKEVFIREKVQEGHPTATAYPPSGQLLDEYEEWRNTHPLE